MTLNIEGWRNYQNECHNWVTTVALSFNSLNNLDPQALAHIFFFLVAHISRHSAIKSHSPVICFCSGRNAGRWCWGQCDKGICCIFISGISINIFWFLLNLSVILWHIWAYFKPALDFLSPVLHEWCTVVRLWLCAVCESCQFLVLPGAVCSKMYRASTHRVLFITANQLLLILLFNQKCTKHRSTVMSFLWSVSAF